jgi:Flp pilus assembly protein TadB
MIRKYQNELIVLAAFLVLAGGFLYQKSTEKALEDSLEHSRTASRQISDIKVLQSVWSTKDIRNKVSDLHNLVSSNQVKRFEEGKKKLIVDFIGLTGQELNLLSTRIASMPVRIKDFSITRAGDKYEMRCQCSW